MKYTSSLVSSNKKIKIKKLKKILREILKNVELKKMLILAFDVFALFFSFLARCVKEEKFS